jgi:hypothetical protein
MKNRMRRRRAPLPPFENGQVWQMGESRVQIDLVGKTLVHFKHFKGDMKRTGISLSSKDALERFLQENKATLLEK